MGAKGPISQGSFGADSLGLGADKATLYWNVVGGRTLHSISTARLLDNVQTSELMAMQAVVSHGQKGISEMLETDSNRVVYVGNIGDSTINVCFPDNRTVGVFVRDPRIEWPDTLALGTDGYLYFTVYQL